MDCRRCQTSTASPAEPGGLSMGGLECRRSAGLIASRLLCSLFPTRVRLARRRHHAPGRAQGTTRHAAGAVAVRARVHGPGHHVERDGLHAHLVRAHLRQLDAAARDGRQDLATHLGAAADRHHGDRDGDDPAGRPLLRPDRPQAAAGGGVGHHLRRRVPDVPAHAGRQRRVGVRRGCCS